MIENNTIFIAHNWSDVSVSHQSKSLAIALSKCNRIIFLDAKKKGVANVRINENLTVLEWPGKRPTGLKDLVFAIRLMKKWRPQIIISNFAANDIMLFVAWLFRVKFRCCYFHTMVEQYIEDHGILPARQRLNILRKGIMFRMATHMLACSTAAKMDLIKYYSIDPSKTFVFPNAIQDTTVRNTGNRNKIGYLGRLDRSKGVDILIEAFALVLRDGHDLILEIAGSGALESRLREQVENLGIATRVSFKGSISYSAVSEYLSSLCFLVVPSRCDNLPTVALESLSVGTPVIGSKSGGIPDIISHGYNGLLFEKESHEDLANKMRELLLDSAKYTTMAINARKSFEEKYCIEQLPDRFECLISSN